MLSRFRGNVIVGSGCRWFWWVNVRCSSGESVDDTTQALVVFAPGLDGGVGIVLWERWIVVDVEVMEVCDASSVYPVLEVLLPSKVGIFSVEG